MLFPYLDFFQMIHSMASYYNSKDSKAFVCMFESCCSMIPNEDPLKNTIYDAYNLYPLTQKNLESSYYLLQWSYMINSYVHKVLYQTNYMIFTDFLIKYDHSHMIITTWSHPTWKMIHYYASTYDLTEKYRLSYKAFISCLQFLLPCPKCKNHLTENLASHPIDKYFGSVNDLFLWSYILHQTVSIQTQSISISLEDARRLYKLNNFSTA